MIKSKLSLCLLLLGIATKTFAGYSSGYPEEGGYGPPDPPPRRTFPKQIWGPFNNEENKPIEVEDESSIEDPSEPQNRNPFEGMQLPPGFPRGQNPFSQFSNPDEGPDSDLDSNEVDPIPTNPGQKLWAQDKNPFPPGQNPFAQGKNPFSPGQNPFNQGKRPPPPGRNPFGQGRRPPPPGRNNFPQGRRPFPPRPNPFPQGQNPFPPGQNPFPTSRNRDTPPPNVEYETSGESSEIDPSLILAEDIPEENKIIFKENVGDKDKGLIQVDVFFDGLCKKSRDFIVNHLFPAWKEFEDIIWINFVPFSGKNRENPENQALDTQIAVIVNNVPVMKKKMCLIRCLMDYSKKGRDQMQVLNYCAKLSHISKPRLDKIIEAVNDPESSEMLEHAKSLAEAKEIENIPTVVIDGVKKDTPKCLKHFKQSLMERAIEKGLDDLIQLTNMNQMIDSPLNL